MEHRHRPIQHQRDLRARLFHPMKQLMEFDPPEELFESRGTRFVKGKAEFSGPAQDTLYQSHVVSMNQPRRLRNIEAL